MRECSFARLGAVDTGSLECSLCLNAIAATPDRRDPLDRGSRARSLWTRLEVSPVDVFDHLGTVAPMSFESSPGHTG